MMMRSRDRPKSNANVMTTTRKEKIMTMTKERTTKNLLLFLLAFFMVFGIALTNVETASAASKYTSKNYDGTNNHHNTVFTCEGMTGTCCEPGKNARSSGTATVTRIDNNTDAAKVAYYWGEVKGFKAALYKGPTSSVNDKGQRLKHALQRTQCSSDADFKKKCTLSTKNQVLKKANEDIATARGVTVPSNFEIYYCKCSDQDFMVWKLNPLGYAYLQKYSSDPKALSLPGYNSFIGINYNVYTAAGAYVGTFSCNAQGKSNTLTLNGGDYYAVETSTTSYYKLNPNPIWFHVDPDRTTPVSATDEINGGTVEIKKDIVGGEAPDETFEFWLTNKTNNAAAYKIMVKGDGAPVSQTIPEGEYTLTEKLVGEQADWFQDLDGPQSVTVTIGQTTKITRKNRKYEKNRLYVNKSTLDNGKLDGFKFKVTGLLNNASELTKNLAIRYAAPEGETAPKVTITDYPDDFTVGDWSVTNESVLTDMFNTAKNREHGTFNVTMKATATAKQDSKDQAQQQLDAATQALQEAQDALENAGPGADLDALERAVSECETAKQEAQAKVDALADREIEITVPIELKDAVYDATEKAYVPKPADQQNQSATGEGYSVAYRSYSWLGAATIYKDIHTGEDYTFLTSNNEGAGMDPNAEDPDIPGIDPAFPGTYTVEEIMTEAQAARYHQPTTQTAELPENQTVPFVFNFENGPHWTGVKLKKTCKDGKVAGISFKLSGTPTSLDEDLVEKYRSGFIATTNANGEIDFGKIHAGEYVIEELTYDPDDYMNPYKLEGYDHPAQRLTITGEEEEDITVEFNNVPVTNLFITKIDAETFDFLPGAEFELIDSEGDVAARFSIELDSETNKQRINLKEAKGDIQVSSAVAGDADTEPIYMSVDRGKAREEKTLGAGFYVALKNLKEGEKYTLKETKCPDGYSQYLEQEFTFEDLTKVVVLNDEPEMGTTAVDKDTGWHQGDAGDPNKEVVIVDTITYKNLQEGRTYVAEGTLMYKPDTPGGEAKPVMSGGKPVTATKEFVAGKNGEGSIEVTFKCKGSDIVGRSVVAFEKFEDPKLDNKIIITHEDPDDPDQTVDYPKIGTTATADDTQDHVTMADNMVTIKDVVKYENLRTGIKYVMKGTLMNKKTGQPIVSNGQPVTAQAEFVPEAPKTNTTTDTTGGNQTGDNPTSDTPGDTPSDNPDDTPSDDDGETFDIDSGTEIVRVSGEVTLTFTFDATALAGTTTVVFEELYTVGCASTDNSTGGGDSGSTDKDCPVPKDKLIGEHKDINDIAQTVYIPKIGTKAAITSTNVIKDTVAYKNLLPGRTYTIEGELIDKETGEPTGYTATKTFVAPKPEGYVVLKFKVDANKLKGKTVVAFEKCYVHTKINGVDSQVEVANHEDINDKAQTVKFKKAPKTGQNLPWILLILGIIAAGSGAYYLRSRKRAKETPTA